jgi:hypothetical protein
MTFKKIEDNIELVLAETKKLDKEQNDLPKDPNPTTKISKSDITDPNAYKNADNKDLTAEEHELQKKYNALSKKYNEDLEFIKDLIDEIDEIENKIKNDYPDIDTYVTTT